MSLVLLPRHPAPLASPPIGDVVQVPLDAEARNELAVLAYKVWSEAFNNLKAVKAEKNDRSQDWDQFHAARLEGAQESYDKAKRVLDQISSFLPMILGR